MEAFDYTFDRLAEIVDAFTEQIGLNTYSLYLMDYGAPVGYRLAAKHPERIESLIVQNGNAYDEGLRDFWIPIKKYWAERTDANAEPLKGFITPKAWNGSIRTAPGTKRSSARTTGMWICAT